MGFEQYCGLTVAILTILVTILITWQIWKSIDTSNIINNINKKFDALRKEISNEIIRSQIAIHIDMAMHSCHNSMRYEEVYHTLWQIVLHSRLGEFTACENKISILRGIADDSIKDTRSSNLKTIASLIENKDMIDNYNDIEGIIDRLFT